MSNNVPINSLKLNRLFRESCKYNNNAFNFIFSHKSTIVCFIHLKDLSSLITVTDLEYNPMFLHKVNAIIAQCNISDSGKYIVWQTATAKNDDSNSIFFYDVENQNLIWKRPAYIHNKYLRGIYIFDFVEVQYDDLIIKYDFEGNEIDKETNYYKLLKSKCVSPYYWNSCAYIMIDALNNNFNKEIEKEITEKIYAAEHNANMSNYQLSLTYRKLGDCYVKHNYKYKALNTYRKALMYNSKIGIKKTIIKLEKEIGAKHLEIKPQKMPVDAEPIQNHKYSYGAEFDKILQKYIEDSFSTKLVAVDNITLTKEEIKLLRYINKRSATDFQIPQYFTYEYKLDLKNTIINFFTGDYIKIADIEFTLNKTTVPVLKAFLKENKIICNGKKTELISIIMNSFSNDVITNHFKERYFLLTKKGENLIQENRELFF